MQKLYFLIDNITKYQWNLIIVQIDFHIQKMNTSLTRKASKGILRNVEDFSASLQQKNNIIAVLQTEVQNLRPNQQKYDRVKEELNRTKNKYEGMLRDHQRSICNNQERLQLSSRSVYELKLQTEHLQDQLRLQSQALKEAKFTSQQLIDYQNRKADEVTEITIKFQEQKSLSEVRKIQEERTRLQIAQVREQVQKGKRESNLIRNQTQALNEKCYKSQSYMRSLLRQEANLNQNLSRVQDENSKIDASISQLDTVVSINNGQISNKQKDCQELQFHIANKQLQKKKIENQIREKVKQLSAEKEKWRSLAELLQQNKTEAARLQAQVSEASTEINFILGKNNQIVEVNNQLNDDLKVCQRHLDNVSRVNKNLEVQIQGLKQTTVKAINKLQIPLNKVSSNNVLNSSGKWGVSSRVTDFQSGDFQKRTSR